MTPSDRAVGNVTRRRLVAAGALGAALILSVIALTQCGGGGRDVAERYAKAWQRQDFAAMHSLLSEESKRTVPLERFVELQRQALATATVRTLTAKRASDPRDGVVSVPFDADTRAFGRLRLTARIPLTADDSEAGVVWNDSLLLPGLERGESLSRTTTMPPRAALLAADGTPLAEGPDRTSPIPDVASEIVGKVGQPDPGAEFSLQALGYPQGTAVGLNGLERLFQQRLAGRPGGALRAGSRILAQTVARPSPPLRTTIVPEIERAAAAALAGRAGGVAVLRPRTGEVLALAGTAFSAGSPPGSTFKIITASAALASGAAKLSDTFPYETGAVLDGRTLQNANGESCGGSLVAAFANSCNSVFAPLGVKVGSEKLVEMAEKYGFNRPMPGIPGASVSSIPQASSIQGEDATGSTAIGQGELSATVLEMATTGATIAAGGFRAQPTLTPVARPTGWRATSRKVADGMRKLMLAVVRTGTGTSAAISGVPVAGKTGTAELVDTTTADNAGDPTNTNAWFVAFAPAWNARVAVAVELDRAGHGGDSAAPAARDVIVAALQSGR